MTRSSHRQHPPSEPADSPLRAAITAAASARGRRAAGVRLSISAEAEWFRPPNADDPVFVKWICWRLVSRRGFPVTKPVYGVVHGELAADTLRDPLRRWFPDHAVVVDHDIALD